MSTLVKSPTWQIDRASRLHQEFTKVAQSIELERSNVTTCLMETAERLSGIVLAGGKPLKASYKTVVRWWYKWLAGGKKSAVLVCDYQSPKHVKTMPRELVREIQRIASSKVGGQDKNGKGVEAPWIRKQLEQRWHAGECLPGLGTWQTWWENNHAALPLPPKPPEFPWSDKTVSRKMGSKVIQKAGNIGLASAGRDLPKMRRNYSKLRRCEFYMLDDVRLDLVAMDELTGRVVEVVCYVLMEVSSRCIVAFVMKPKDAIRAEDVDELIACGLQADGFGIGIGYVTHIWFERGSVACTEAAQRVLEAGSEGGIQIHRTRMNKGTSWAGAAADKAVGHSAGKAAMEAFNGKLHDLLRHLPGQRGNTRDNQPLNLGVGDSEAKNPGRSQRDSVRMEAERLQQIRLTALAQGVDAKIKLPILTIAELHVEMTKALRLYHGTRGHDMQGFHTVTEAEVQPGVWMQTESAA